MTNLATSIHFDICASLWNETAGLHNKKMIKGQLLAKMKHLEAFLAHKLLDKNDLQKRFR